MAKRHASAVRQHRRSGRATRRNARNTARVKTALRKIRGLIAGKKVEESKQLLNPTLSLLDHSVSLKALHRNAAARLKSRLMRQVLTAAK